MTLDEAIVHCYKKSQEQAFFKKDKCSLEHKQLHEWLKELKESKKPTLEDYIQALPYLTFKGYGEETLEVTDDDWAYAPTLYKFEGKWLIDWVEGEDHDSGKVIEGATPIEAARNSYSWCVGKGFIKDTLSNGQEES